MASTSSQPLPLGSLAANTASDDDTNSRQAFFLSQRDLPPLPDTSQHVWNKHNEKQLRSALIGACKRMPRNAEAHFHLGLMHMRSGDFEPALRSFQHARKLAIERFDHYQNNNIDPPPALKEQVARVRSHCAQAAHHVALALERDKHAGILMKTQRELIASIKQDCASPDAWNALGLVHLNEGGNTGARDVFRTIRQSFPDYLDALNNVGVAELALGHEEVAISCFQKVLLCDREHVEALSNYGVILLRHGMYDAALRAFDAAVKGAPPDSRGLPFAWGGLAVAQAALGFLDAADSAARRAESSAALSNRPRFAMLRASIYARRVADACRRGLSWESATTTFGTPDRAQSPSPSTPDADDGSDAGSNTRDAGDQDDMSNDDEDENGNRAADVADSTIIGDGNSSNRDNNDRGGAVDHTIHGNGGPVVLNNDGQRAISQIDQPATSRPSNVSGGASVEDLDPRPAIDGAVLRLRALARELQSSSASTALGAALRLRHDCALEESGNRNFGAEAAERLVEALEMDDDDATAWVQLGLLQLGTGEYVSARDFSVQAVSRNGNVEAGWNSLAVASQLHDDVTYAATAYETALDVIRANYNKNDRWPRPRSSAVPDTVRRLVFPLPDESHADEDEGSPDMLPRSANGTLGEHGAAGDEDVHDEPDDDDVRRLNAAGRNALAAVYNNIGNLRRQEGRDFSEALSAYEKSLKVGGEDPVVYNNLAILYISSDKLDDAGRMLDHALKLDPKLECAISNRLKLTALMRKRESSLAGVDEELGDFAGDLDDEMDLGEDEIEEEDEDERENQNDSDSRDSGFGSEDDDDNSTVEAGR